MDTRCGRRLLGFVVVGSLIVACASGAWAQGVLSEPFDPIEQLSGVDGRNGAVFDGVASRDGVGDAVAFVGDVDADGIDDVAIGAGGAGAGGETYVLFGRGPTAGGSLQGEIRPGDLDGVLGFRLIGPDSSSGSVVVAAGDFNGDGIDDLAVSDPFANGAAGSRSGVTWVVFGRAGGFPADVRLSELDGSDGVALAGIGGSGSSVSAAGDVNGDGLGDLIIGAPRGVGEAYVVYGSRDGFPASIDLTMLDGVNGFRLVGASRESAGQSVAGVGDVDADGVDDVAVGAPEADVRAAGGQGQTYVVYGRAGGFPAMVELPRLGADEGARLLGDVQFVASGSAVSAAGDFNDDGIDDLAVGAAAWGPDTARGNGACYVVYGVAGGLPPVFELSDLDGDNGFKLVGPRGGANLANAIASVGDIDRDGVDDLLIGAAGSYDGARRTGFAYLVSGRSGGGFGASVDIETLVGRGVVRFQGEETQDAAGSDVSGGGDVNADGVLDLIIGAADVDAGGVLNAGRAYVLYGRDPSRCVADFDGDGTHSVADFLLFQNLFGAGDPAADFDGDREFTIFDFLAFQNAFDAGCP
ncbi:MAG: integrin alpha [Phycisphaerales bacterium]|jgi:hypothetical protein